MSYQPFSVSDSKQMYSNRLYTSNYDYSFSSNLSNINNNDLNKNKKITIGLNNNDGQKNYYNQSPSNNNTNNYMINNKNLSLNNNTNNCINQMNNNNISINQMNNNNICMNQQINQPLNRIQQNLYNQQSQMARIKRNLPPNCKNNEIRMKSPQFKQNIPFYKNISLNSSTYENNSNNIQYQPKHLLSPKQNLTDRSSSNNNQHPLKNNQISLKNNQSSLKNNELSSYKFEQFNSQYLKIINKRNSNNNGNSNKNQKKDTINENNLYSNNDKQNNKQNNSQRSSKKDNINNININNINLQNSCHTPLNTNKIQKNSWHRKSKSIQFPPIDYKINQKQLYHQKQTDSLQQLKQRVKYMQNMIKDNIFSLQKHQVKIQKLQLSFLQQNQSKNDLINNLLTSQALKRSNNKHSRTNSSSSNNNYRQLSDIMSLIEQNKNYQIKNSDQYRKMIQQFRSTILEFRDQLNRTIKKQQLDEEVKKIKQSIHININNINNNKKIDIGQNIINQNNENSIFNNSFIQKSVLQLKQKINKLQDSNLYLKAQIVKINVKDKKSSQDNISKFQYIQKKINNVHNSLPIFEQRNCKRSDKRYQQRPICFSVNQNIKKQTNQQIKMPKQSIRRSNSSTQSQGSHLRFSHSRSPSSNLADSGYKYNYNLYDSNIYEEKDTSVSKRIYYIDKQGYLLDKDSYYLLDSNNEIIKLSDTEIQILKKLNVLEFTQNY